MIRAIVMVALLPTLLFAAMSDTAALTEAKKRFGTQGAIAKYQTAAGSTWYRQVGVQSPQCKRAFTILGEGVNSWEKAFAAVHPVAVEGVYSGFVSLEAVAWNEVGVASFTWFVDGVAIVPNAFRYPPETRLNVAVNWDTKSVPPGVHVLCGQSKDIAGTITSTNAVVIRVDQAVASISSRIMAR